MSPDADRDRADRLDATTASAPVLLAYDGSVASDHAIRIAATVLPTTEAIVVNVWEPLRTLSAGNPGSPVVAPTAQHDQASQAESLVQQGIALAREAGFAAVSARPEGRSGRVWTTILDVADEAGASVIVVGGKGRSAVKSVLLGSVSHALAQHADRPLLIVPTTSRDGA